MNVDDLRRELQDDATLKALEDEARIRHRRRLHAFAGAVTFFALLFLAGLPDSLLPANLLVNALISAGAGLPLGYLISRFNAGPVKGALISAAFFLVLGAILAGGAQAVLWGALGLLPGALIGWHVELDT